MNYLKINKNKWIKLNRKILALAIAVSFTQQINFVYAGSKPNSEQVNKNGTTMVNEQVQAAQGAEGTNGSNLNNAANLANALNSAESAGAASGQQSGGAGFNMGMSVVTAGMGVMLIDEGLATTPAVDKMKIAMGGFMLLQSAMALSQSLNQGKTSKANRKAGNGFLSFDNPESSTANNGNGSTGDASEDLSNPLADSKGFNTSKSDLPPAAQDILKKIEDQGYKVDLKNNTFSTPDGHSISLGAGSQGGAAVESQLGLPPGTYAKGMGIIEDIAKRQGIATGAGFDSSGSSSLGGLGGESSSDGTAGSEKKSNGLERSPASTLVAGLTSKYQGENIGVAADDIFLMVTRRYQLKHQQDLFITPEHPQKGVLVNPPFNSRK